MICKDLKSAGYVLMDNLSYEYVNDERLIEDFQSWVLKELGVKL